MHELIQLKKMKKADLVTLAKKLRVKGIVHSNKLDLAKKIILKRREDELNQEPEPVVVSEPEPGPQLKPEFEELAAELPSDEPGSEPEQPYEPADGRGGYREGAGRTPGLTDEKARAQRVLKNEVPDPAIEFLVETVFLMFGHGKPKKIPPTPKAIALPVTNLLAYYFPNVRVSPVIKVWTDLGIHIDALVVSRIQSTEPEPKTETETKQQPELDLEMP